MTGALAALLRRRKALLKGHFLLSSGLHSDQYVQCARLFEDPRDAQTVGRWLARLVRALRAKPSAIVSPAMGGILIGHETAKALRVPFLFTERVDGRMALRRGFSLRRGQRIAVVEDVFTTGKSTCEVLDLVRRLGAKPVAAVSVITRNADLAALSRRRRVRFGSLLSLPLEAHAPAKCPMCAAGKPFIKPGSRGR